MMKTLLGLIFFIISSQFLFSQKLDLNSYLNLFKEEFILYAKSADLSTNFDENSQTIFAVKKGFVFGKPLDNKNDNEYYKLALILSTTNKENNNVVLEKATKVPQKENTWTDDNYLYIEWDTENPETKEMWYKILVYKKK